MVTVRMINALIQFFIQYKYIALFPVAILEGPIVSVLCGFLISTKALSFFPTFVVVFLGDVVSDTFFYMAGKGGRKFVHYVKISDERLYKIEKQYEQSPWKTMIIAKISYGLGAVFMAASGMGKMTYKKFCYYMCILNAIRSLILLGIGFYFGRLAVIFGHQYLTYYVITMCIIVPSLYLIIKKIQRTAQRG